MNYYRKPINKVIDGVKLKMQLGALTIKISENNNKIDSLLKVDKNMKNDVSSNLGKITANEGDISSNLEKVTTNEGKMSSNLGKITNISDFLTLKKDFEKIYNIQKRIFRFNITKHFYTILEEEIEYDFSKNGLLFVKKYIL